MLLISDLMGPLFAVAGMVSLLAVPATLTLGFGQPLLPATLHLFTLGVLVTGGYGVLHHTWERCYGVDAPKRWLLGVALLTHVTGVVILVWGFLRHDTFLADWGGHYLVPAGGVLMLAHGIVATWRRQRGRPRELWSHLPMLGLLVAGTLGVLLVMDARLASYRLYLPSTLLIHLLSGGFLFVLPLLLLPQRPQPTSTESTLPADLLRLFAATGIGGGGVLAVALALAPDGQALALPVGLVLLGGLCLWLGLPLRWEPALVGLEGLRRLGYTVSGLVIIYAAIRVWRHAPPAEMLALARIAVTAFLFTLALPNLFSRLALATGQSERLVTRTYRMQFAGAVVLLAGALSTPYLPAAGLVRAGTLVWLVGLSGLLLFAVGKVRAYRPGRD